MKINPRIFKEYDIRGIYPDEINEKVAYKIGQAFINFVRKKRKVKKIDILVGRDNRLSSSSLLKALSWGIIDSGANVISIGICTTPMFYFASRHYKIDDGGIMITASHLPKGYNGFKLVREMPIPIDAETGLNELKKLTQETLGQVTTKPGNVMEKNILKEYVKFNLKDFDLDRIAPLKIVIDTGNAPTGIIIPEIFKKTNCKIFHLFSKLDGHYPNRPPDCLRKGILKKLQREVLNKKADFGVAFDGDGDRMVYIDEKGKFISPNIITAFMADVLLKERPGEKIIFTVRGSRIISEIIKKNKGRGIISPVGHSNVKRKMKRDNILFGGEASGHYYYRDHDFSEAPFFVLFKTLEVLSKTKKKISELILPFEKYYRSGEINFKVKNSGEILQNLENKFGKSGKILKIDGLRVDFKDWWFLVRPSRTESVLRLSVEAETKKLMEEKKKELTKLINNQ